MTLQAIKQASGEITMESIFESIPDFAKDIKLNLQSVLTKEGAPGLTEQQRIGVALACAYSVKNQDMIRGLKNEFNPSSELDEAAKSAAAIMAMNNVYYRFVHLTDDKDFSKMPARLRMNVIGRPPVPKTDFELMSLAISSINGCGMCMNAHIHEVRKGEINNEGIQSVIRIAAVINAASLSLAIA